MAFTDPDAPKPKPKAGTKTTPKTTPKAPGTGANAEPYAPRYKDDGSYIGSRLRPGFARDQGSSYKEYDTWLANQQSDDAFNALRAKYGDLYVSFEWWAFRNNISDNQYFNALDMRFKGWREIQIGPGDGPGRTLGGGGASLAEQYAAAEAAIRNEAGTIGRPMTEAEIKAMAKQAVDGDWTGDQLTDALTGDPTKISQPGTFAAMADQIKGMAAQQLIKVSDATAKEWARQIISGEKDIVAVANIFANQASAEFGWAAGQIKQGTTMRDILMPARDTLAGELEVNPDTIDFNDQKWRKMVQTQGLDGKPRAATLTEVTQAARKAPEWTNTSNAGRLAANMATMLRQAFEGG